MVDADVRCRFGGFKLAFGGGQEKYTTHASGTGIRTRARGASSLCHRRLDEDDAFPFAISDAMKEAIFIVLTHPLLHPSYGAEQVRQISADIASLFAMELLLSLRVRLYGLRDRAAIGVHFSRPLLHYARADPLETH